MAKKKKKKKKQRVGRSVRRRPIPKLDPNGVDVSFAESLRRYEMLCADGTHGDDFDPRDMVLEMHPDVEKLQKLGRPLPDEVETEAGEFWNPQLHLGMHAAIESHLLKNEPKGIFELACAFEDEGKIGTHQIRHAIMDVFAVMIWSMQKEDKPFDSEAYLAEIPKSYRRYCGEG